MADDTPLSDPPSPARRRLPWPRGLSARLLLATVLMVALANLIIVPVLLATRQREWLSDRVAAGELASYVVGAAQGKVPQKLKQQILASAGLVAVSVESGGVLRSVLAPTSPQHVVYEIDLRQQDPLSSLSAPLETLLGGGDRMVLVTDRPHYVSGQLVKILVPDRPLHAILLSDLGELLIGALFTSAMAGALAYLLLNFFLVRPMQRITRSMERFRANPEDATAALQPSGRRDEIGRAEVELGLMQSDLRTALASRARLAALGEAVAKINHEMRNMLTSAQLASERLAASGDPVVARTLPGLERALDRAVRLATNVLAFGHTEEPGPALKAVPLKAALEMAAEDARLSAALRLAGGIDDCVQVTADPDQLHRILVNLMRNARQAMDADKAGGEATMTVSLTAQDGVSVIRLADSGPGLPERARANLFQPFRGSARPGGAGLGLAISRELALAHGGDLALVDSRPSGAVFELRLPGAPAPPAKPDGRQAAEADA